MFHSGYVHTNTFAFENASFSRVFKTLPIADTFENGVFASQCGQRPRSLSETMMQSCDQ